MADWRKVIWRWSVLTLGTVAVSIAAQAPGSPAVATSQLEERKLPMKFAWNACAADCKGWISAVGVVTDETPGRFDEFAKGRDLAGTSIVLDSSGGSVNDALALGRRWRKLNATITVGMTVSDGERNAVRPEAYCESMCVFLLLSGKTRYVPEAARVRVHQIWMGDRADNARAASYTAHDLTIVERDIGRLVKYTFDMGGTGDLVALALSVPPWEDLHRLSSEEMQAANLITTLMPPSGSPPEAQNPADVVLSAKPLQDRFAGESAVDFIVAGASRPTQTADAHPANAPVTSPER